MFTVCVASLIWKSVNNPASGSSSKLEAEYEFLQQAHKFLICYSEKCVFRDCTSGITSDAVDVESSFFFFVISLLEFVQEMCLIKIHSSCLTWIHFDVIRYSFLTKPKKISNSIHVDFTTKLRSFFQVHFRYFFENLLHAKSVLDLFTL